MLFAIAFILLMILWELRLRPAGDGHSATRAGAAAAVFVVAAIVELAMMVK